ncbi:type II toxin-antitoxin system RelE/ParE family toxin [Sphingomonas immobilis]|uniref:Type II toxin-antitoxin system RelE/ParE family toxin n=1 Tax=Sphingomonas immobilis TaxID=3063997 RepID=A0ABT8ZTI0_9SPHN|nr:type II toxin-antitoxin system RelE/ParE family toxin [Sphingomonas sp. CA1-15]MDO7840867.1 type II toxin-antitoxin system RelE/ParE family toxin [Sphingomonas sp. CA1-15]
MRILWSNEALADLARLSAFLEPVAPDTALRVVERLTSAPDRLSDFPRLGEKLDDYAPREVRRLRVDAYEMRYEITSDAIFIVRVWHHREERSSAP